MDYYGSRREVKQERSVPAQSRVDLVDLANAAKYWLEKDVEIRTMSQLVAWTVSAFVHIMSESGQINGVIDELGTAVRFLENLGLYSGSMKDRSRRKLSAAMALESLRGEGINPALYAPQQHKMLHRSNAVNAIHEKNYGSGKFMEDLNYVDESEQRKFVEKESRRWGDLPNESDCVNKMDLVQPQIEQTNSGRANKSEQRSVNEMSSEEFIASRQKREREIEERENAPIDMNGLKFVDE